MALDAEVHRRVKREVLGEAGAMHGMATEAGHGLFGTRVDDILPYRVRSRVDAFMAFEA